MKRKKQIKFDCGDGRFLPNKLYIIHSIILVDVLNLLFFHFERIRACMFICMYVWQFVLVSSKTKLLARNVGLYCCCIGFM